MSRPALPADPARRRFLAHGSAGLAGLAGASLLPAGLLPAAARAEGAAGAGQWQNWSGGQSAQPAGIFFPGSEEELVNVVKTAKPPLRAFGGSHSFSPLVPTPGTLVSLEQMTALVAHDPQQLTATLTGGTRIAVAGEMLAAIGQNLENEPDINLQSLAGAISTATHGTGSTLKCLSAYVTQLKLVLADGSVVTCSANKDRELFEAARVSFGSIGILSEITLRNRTAYKLREDVQVMNLADAMHYIDQRKNVDRHIEFLAFPYGDKAIIKRMNITDEADTPPVEHTFDENELLELAADTVKAAPFTKGLIQKLVGTFVSEGHRVGPAQRIFPSPRSVPFNEMEYTVPAEQGLACLQEVIAVMRERDIGVFFPIEYRYIAADDTWLSPFSQRAGAAISIHQYARQDYRELFDAVEPILKKYGGRPHWGKLHTLAARDLQTLYPRFADFLAVRKRVDPQGRLLNPYTKTLLGV
ncbi:MAG: D-arabinono-1,4-lactone oxidase [Pseudomonadota bacterium]